MKFHEKLPIYLQVSDLIKNKILNSEFEPGEKLPSVRDLSVKFKVNPNTVQRAYSNLEEENLVFVRRGMGTFVTENTRDIKDSKELVAKTYIEKFLNEMEALGISKEELIKIISKID